MSTEKQANTTLTTSHHKGCMVCGEPLKYFEQDKDLACAYCGRTFSANAACLKGHYVCDKCHAEEGNRVIEEICLSTSETDMVSLFQEIRRSPFIPMHGPQYHSMMPGIIISTYRNLGGEAVDADILTGIKRGKMVGGGFCGFTGGCGAALGVGIAFGVLLKSNPLRPLGRQIVMKITGSVIEELSKLKAARCCQRDCWIGLQKAVEWSKELLPVALKAEAHLICEQTKLNKQCFGKRCPLYGEG